MPNPFYVQPATADVTPVVQGLGAIAKSARDAKQKQRAETDIMGAIQSGDPMKVAEMSIKYPQHQKMAMEAFGITNEATKAAAKETYQRVLSDPENADIYLQDGIERVSAADGRPDMMSRDLEMYRADPDAALKRINMGYAGVDPEGFKTLFGGGRKGAGIKAFQPITLVNKKTKEKQLVSPTVDPQTGKAELAEFDIPEGFEVSRETPQEERAADVLAAGKKKGLETTAKGEATRRQDWIDKGLVAADSMANLSRGLELLDSVKTGGFNAAALRAKQLFGFESADEGELSNRLSKAVLSQLRETFGAAFTKPEGDKLDRIEANFSKSPEANRRLLEQTKRIVTRSAKRGIKAAMASGDFDTAREIEEALEFSLSPEPKAEELSADEQKELEALRLKHQ